MGQVARKPVTSYGDTPLGPVIAMALCTVAVIQRSGATALFRENRRCCRLSFLRNLQVTFYEAGGLTKYSAEIGQDKWVLEKVFPDVANGYFVDVGSGHGTIGSNSRTLEERGWRGVCIDPFPVHMEGRTCEMFREVVFSKARMVIGFHTAGGLGGVADTLPNGMTRRRARQRRTLPRSRSPRSWRVRPLHASSISCPWTSRGLNWRPCGHSPSTVTASRRGPSSTTARSPNEARLSRCSHNMATDACTSGNRTTSSCRRLTVAGDPSMTVTECLKSFSASPVRSRHC